MHVTETFYASDGIKPSGKTFQHYSFLIKLKAYGYLIINSHLPHAYR